MIKVKDDTSTYTKIMKNIFIFIHERSQFTRKSSRKRYERAMNNVDVAKSLPEVMEMEFENLK